MVSTRFVALGLFLLAACCSQATARSPIGFSNDFEAWWKTHRCELGLPAVSPDAPPVCPQEINKIPEEIARAVLDELSKRLDEVPQPQMFSALPPLPTIEGVPQDRKEHTYVPETVEQVQKIVRFAVDNGYVVRVRGSGHSPKQAVFDDAQLPVQLVGDLMKVTVHSNSTVTAGGGCFIGYNPFAKYSTQANGLTVIMKEHSLALPILGGMDHQTVAGFLSTGSSGGSVKYGIGSALTALQFVDGTGQLRTVSRHDSNPDAFFAAGVSLGLFGVIVSATFTTEPEYFVEGTEENFHFADSAIASFANFKHASEDLDYFHMNYFPSIARTLEWRGDRAPVVPNGIPYANPISKRWAQLYAIAVIKLGDAEMEFLLRIRDIMLKLMLPVGKPVVFNDIWSATLPNDNGAVANPFFDTTHFTEVWLPYSEENFNTVMARLKTALSADPSMGGPFAIEFYSAPASDFWMSQGYGRPSLRVDPYFATGQKGTENAFFKKYWDILLDIPGARLHPGKFMPTPGQQCGPVRWDLAHLRTIYPHLDEFLAFRAQFDPKQVFVTDYWRGQFEIPPVAPSAGRTEL